MPGGCRIVRTAGTRCSPCVKNAAEKLKSGNEQTRAEGQKELERELQNQNAAEDVDRQLQQLASDAKTKEDSGNQIQPNGQTDQGRDNSHPDDPC